MIAAKSINGLGLNIFHLPWLKSYPRGYCAVNQNLGQVLAINQKKSFPHYHEVALRLDWALGLVVLVLMSGLLACGANSNDNTAAGRTETVRGLILEVNAASLLDLDSVTVEGLGRQPLAVRGSRQEVRRVHASHLREHMVLGQMVTVTFHRENDVLVPDDITD